MEKEFKITYTKGTGPGGQHKNKVETCVVIKHLPTGMTEKCEDTRSKIRNEKIAMERLLRRIEDENRRLLDEKKNDHRKEQIKNKKTKRTYNYPRNEVIDHETGKRANLKKVLDGNLDLLR
jgi:peptide chain release factor 1